MNKHKQTIIDLSKFVVNIDEMQRSIDIQSEIIKEAAKKISHLNEKTVEQVIILKQKDYIEKLEHVNEELVESLEWVLKDYEGICTNHFMQSANAMDRINKAKCALESNKTILHGNGNTNDD